MFIKTFLAKKLAAKKAREIQAWSNAPVESQKKTLAKIISKAKNTEFGKEHDFKSIKNYADYKERVAVREYESFKPYFDKIVEGKSDVTWPGRPIYLAKTSGTTSGAKYIPITKDSIHNHMDTARNMLLMYIHHSGNPDFSTRKMIFLSGSPELEDVNGIPTGRLSGIVNHHIPFYLKLNRLPSYKTNCIEDWEVKVERIIDETINQDMSLISGIPPWVQMYFERLQQRSGKTIKELFPNLSIFAHGGVNYEPYRKKIETLIAGPVQTLESYPASEGFIAFQDQLTADGMLLNLYDGIFFEFIALETFFDENPERITIEDVELDKNYVVILSSNAGLWSYNLGDTIRFVSLNPYRITVTGRVKHFISAFGEHVIVEEVESAITELSREMNIDFNEFTVAPVMSPQNDLPHHQWIIEFSKNPENLEQFRLKLDKKLCEKNSYYSDLVSGKILSPLKIRSVADGTFKGYLKSVGKLGGQNKVPRVNNEEEKIEKFIDYINQRETVKQ